MNHLATYKNGNYTVTIYDDGSKVRNIPDSVVAQPDYPESIDVKITNYCDAGCAFCHENSTREGLHGDIEFGLNLFGPMPKGTELAIGGGNPLSHPNLRKFLTLQEPWFNSPKICNLTVNSFHITRYESFIKKHIFFGLGISYLPQKRDSIISFMRNYKRADNVVLHLIAGVHTPEDLDWYMSIAPRAKVLLLGYKTFGRGIHYKQKLPDLVDARIQEWRNILPKYMFKCTLSFDNLAIEQLNIRSWFTQKQWDTFYMGDDGRYTMYIDLVNKTYAKSSTSVERFPIGGQSIKDIFAHIRRLHD